MITINQINQVSIANVNSGILKVKNDKYVLCIPVYPKFRNRNIVNFYNSLNAPQIFHNNLKDNVNDEKELLFYEVELSDISITKDLADSLLKTHMVDVTHSDVYDFFINNDLKSTIEYMTNKNDDNLPMFVYRTDFL